MTHEGLAMRPCRPPPWAWPCRVRKSFRGCRVPWQRWCHWLETANGSNILEIAWCIWCVQQFFSSSQNLMKQSVLKSLFWRNNWDAAEVPAVWMSRLGVRKCPALPLPTHSMCACACQTQWRVLELLRIWDPSGPSG